MGIVPAVGLAQGTAPAAAVPAGTVRVEVPGIVPARGIDRAEAVLWVPGTGWAEEPAGTVPARGIDRAGAVLSAPGTGRAGVLAGTGLAAGTVPARGIGRPSAERGTGPVDIGQLGAGPSCGCS